MKGMSRAFGVVHKRDHGWKAWCMTRQYLCGDEHRALPIWHAKV